MMLDILYGGWEGGQRVISQFTLRRANDRWLTTTGKHFNVDRPDPRQRRRRQATGRMAIPASERKGQPAPRPRGPESMTTRPALHCGYGTAGYQPRPARLSADVTVQTASKPESRTGCLSEA